MIIDGKYYKDFEKWFQKSGYAGYSLKDYMYIAYEKGRLVLLHIKVVSQNVAIRGV